MSDQTLVNTPAMPRPTSRISFSRTAILVLVFCLIAFLVPHPHSITPAAWRFFSLFIVTVLGLMIQPMPGGAVVLLGVTFAALVGGKTIAQSLSGYADPVAWLVLTSNFIARALINTGLARRIALSFIRRFGKNPISLCYSLSLSDMLLAMMVPANSARSGGIILPIALSISELYESFPGPSASRIGSFLISSLYQCICITPAMFLTGQVSNLLAAQMAGSVGYPISWIRWAAAGIVPGLVSLALVPTIVWRLNPPQIHHTPEAESFAKEHLAAMGPPNTQEKILTGVVVAICLMWATSSWSGINITLTAFIGLIVLLFTGILTWDDIKGEKAAWDIFIWYGGLLFFGRALGELGVLNIFAGWMGSLLGHVGWVTLFLVTLVIYFYAHYAFASITAHLLSMYPAFISLLLLRHSPLGLVAFAFACFANLSAGLTHYGTTPSPMFFSKEYVSLKQWWTIGLVVSVVNILIWGTIGFGWWHIIRIW